VKILIVEEERAGAAFLARGLREAGYSVDVAHDGMEGLELAGDGRFDALIVDRHLPRLDGLGLVEALRQAGREVPVLIVSDMNDVDDRVRTLRAGADDYISKPYAVVEVIARLEAVLRRREKGGVAPLLKVGDLELDRMSRTVRRGGAAIKIQPLEFRILEYLLRHAGQVVTRTNLLEALWDFNFDPQTNVIDVHISRLRARIDRGYGPPLIHTVRGAGYMIRVGD
jgi:two-component system OmpR family response regulator